MRIEIKELLNFEEPPRGYPRVFIDRIKAFLPAETALHEALERGDPEVLQDLERHPAAVDDFDKARIAMQVAMLKRGRSIFTWNQANDRLQALRTSPTDELGAPPTMHGTWLREEMSFLLIMISLDTDDIPQFADWLNAAVEARKQVGRTLSAHCQESCYDVSSHERMWMKVTLQGEAGEVLRIAEKLSPAPPK